jgi:Zinc carboxypeptidase
MKGILFILCACSFAVQAQTKWPEDLLLTPEKSNFVKTSTHAEVMAFLKAIEIKSNEVHLTSMGKSLEGKDIPVAVLARPKITSAGEAKASGKVIVYVQGNIHAGEVEGKESVMMLMREILLGNKKHLLDNQIILFAPIYNTDSNDKMGVGKRPSQEDSPLETGDRENSQGFDLNRDGVKMETFETNGLFANIIRPWDPHVFVDLHTTNGTWHAWNLTWAPSYHYAGEKSTYDYTINMLKDITGVVKKKYDLNFGPYGDYDVQEAWPPRNFYTYNHHPRYLVNQFSLRNRIGILSEAFAHERFYQRIFSTYAFVAEILEHTNAQSGEIQRLTKEADAKTIQTVVGEAGKTKKGVRYKMVPLEQLNNFPTYDYVSYTKADGSIGYYRTGNMISVDDVTYHAKFEAEVDSKLPKGYIIPAAFSFVAENLKKHGIVVTQLTKPITKEVEVFEVSTHEKSQRKFEGHFMARVSGKFVQKKQKFSKGDYVVELTQPLGNLAFYLLEPESDDGYVTWNFFDEYIEKQRANDKVLLYPVSKYFK